MPAAVQNYLARPVQQDGTGVLEPLKVGSQADTILVTGPTGSEKTHCEVRRRPALPADPRPQRCLRELLGGPLPVPIALPDLGPTREHSGHSPKVHPPRDVLLNRLRTQDDQPCVAILDEVDQFDEKDLLYDLLNLPGFSLLLIVNREEDLFDGLDDRLASRLGGCERISFDRYTVDELVDILRETAETESIPKVPERREIGNRCRCRQRRRPGRDYDP